MDQLLGLLDETQASLKQFAVAQAPDHHVQATMLPWKVTTAADVPLRGVRVHKLRELALDLIDQILEGPAKKGVGSLVNGACCKTTASAPSADPAGVERQRPHPELTETSVSSTEASLKSSTGL